MVRNADSFFTSHVHYSCVRVGEGILLLDIKVRNVSDSVNRNPVEHFMRV